MSDEIRDDEAQQEDVEGHGLVNAPGVSAPNINRDDDAGDDVEGHGLVNAPGVNAPNINRDDDGDDVEAHGMINAAEHQPAEHQLAAKKLRRVFRGRPSRPRRV